MPVIAEPSFMDSVRHVARVAAAAADEVDRDGRFPHEALAALRERRLLSALLPVADGGMGATISELSHAVRTLAASCSASALVLAMHSIDVSNLIRCGSTDSLRQLLQDIAAEQLLCANANSEVGVGGDVGRSLCAIESVDGRLTLIKEALAISYGEHADLIFACARRSPDSEPTDQVQAIFRRGDALEPLSEWRSIGLRGTCSRSFRIETEIDPDWIYPIPFSVIANTGGVHVTMLLLSSVWVGLAEAAAAKAHAYVRAAARRSIGSTPKSAVRLAELTVCLDQIRALLRDCCARVEAADETERQDPLLLAALRNLKVATSEGAVAAAKTALEICGIAGYRLDTPFSLDRLLRDGCGGLVMVSNERMLQAGAEMLAVRKAL